MEKLTFKWQNGKAPALNADNLQKITDTINGSIDEHDKLEELVTEIKKSEVIANPTDKPSGVLYKVGINGEIYALDANGTRMVYKLAGTQQGTASKVIKMLDNSKQIVIVALYENTFRGGFLFEGSATIDLEKGTISATDYAIEATIYSKYLGQEWIDYGEIYHEHKYIYKKVTDNEYEFYWQGRDGYGTQYITIDGSDINIRTSHDSLGSGVVSVIESEGISNEWSDLKNKPFESLNPDNFLVSDDGELSVIGGGSSESYVILGQQSGESSKTFSFSNKSKELYVFGTDFSSGSVVLKYAWSINLDDNSINMVHDAELLNLYKRYKDVLWDTYEEDRYTSGYTVTPEGLDFYWNTAEGNKHIYINMDDNSITLHCSHSTIGSAVVSVIEQSGSASWEDLEDKPFKSLNPDNFEVNENGELSVIGGGSGGGGSTGLYYSDSANILAKKKTDKYFGVYTREIVQKDNIPSVPRLMGDTGNIIYSSIYDASWLPFHAYDDDANTFWLTENGKIADEYIGYIFDTPTKVNKVGMNLITYSWTNASIKKFKVQGSDDGSVWEDVSSVLTTDVDKASEEQIFTFDNNKAYTRYRILIVESFGSEGFTGLSKLQFYSFENVPTDFKPLGGGSGSIIDADQVVMSDGKSVEEAVSSLKTSLDALLGLSGYKIKSGHYTGTTNAGGAVNLFHNSNFNGEYVILCMSTANEVLHYNASPLSATNAYVYIENSSHQGYGSKSVSFYWVAIGKA